MMKQVLLDKLSEFLAVEQAGAQLYRVVASRTTQDELRQRYIEFGKETETHREILIKVITAMGGDPNYVSPTARVAMTRGEEMLCLALKADGLSPEELDCVDLESVVLAETKDHADWSLLARLIDMIPDEKTRAIAQEAVDQVEAQEDEHLEWAKEKLMTLSLQAIIEGPEPGPERWQNAWTGPHFTLDMHPAPMEKGDGLLKPAELPAWTSPPVARDVKATV
jgi:rubrerythrin